MSVREQGKEGTQFKLPHIVEHIRQKKSTFYAFSKVLKAYLHVRFTILIKKKN